MTTSPPRRPEPDPSAEAIAAVMAEFTPADTDTDTIPGQPLIGRDTIARLADRSPQTIATAATAGPHGDAHFPLPVGGTHQYTPEDAADYIARVRARDAARRPPPVVTDLPDHTMLTPDDLADLFNKPRATIDNQVRQSKPFWAGKRPGVPPLPLPTEPATLAEALAPRARRRWRLDAIRAHQATRPREGEGAGPKPRTAHPR